MMIDGITILDTTSVWICDNIVFDILLISVAIIAISLLISLASSDEAGFVIFLLTTLLILLFSTCVAYKTLGKEVPEYKVTISDTVSFKDIYGKYEIISQEGDLYTIREKIAENS